MTVLFKRFSACLCAILMLFAIVACNTGGNNDGEVSTDIPTEIPAEVMNTGTTDIPDITEAPIDTDVPHFTSVPFENAVLTPEDVATLNEYSNLGSYFQNLLETEDSLYIAKEGLLYYSDKEHHEWMPLCGKPECVHAYDNVNCNAYIGGDAFAPKIEYYNGYIYYVDEISTYAYDPIKLYRMKLDGSDHELFGEVGRPFEEEGLGYDDYWSSKYFCGRYFLYDYKLFGADDSDTDLSGVYVVDLGDIEKAPIKLDDSLGQEGKTFGIHYIAQKGELLYSMANGEDNGIYIAEQNLSTGEGRILAELNNWINVGERQFTIYGNEALLMTTDMETLERWLFRLDLETGEMTEIAYDGEVTQFWSNLDPKAGIMYTAAQAGSRFGDTWVLGVSDINGNELWRVGEEVLPEGVDTLVRSFSTADYIFFHDKNDAEYFSITPKWYVEKSAIAMGHVEIKAWEP